MIVVSMTGAGPHPDDRDVGIDPRLAQYSAMTGQAFLTAVALLACAAAMPSRYSYSDLMATIGCTAAARRADGTPASTATTNAVAAASA